MSDREDRQSRPRWYGTCAECGARTDLAYRPGTSLKVCSGCMWPEDVKDEAGSGSSTPDEAVA